MLYFVMYGASHDLLLSLLQRAANCYLACCRLLLSLSQHAVNRCKTPFHCQFVRDLLVQGKGVFPRFGKPSRAPTPPAQGVAPRPRPSRFA